MNVHALETVASSRLAGALSSFREAVHLPAGSRAVVSNQPRR